MHGKNLCPRRLASDRLARGTWRRDWPRAFTGGSPHQHEPMALKSRVDFSVGRCAVTCSPTSPICHAPHGVLLILGACRRRRIGETRHRLHGHWWAQRVGDHLVAEPDVWLQHRPQRTTRRTGDGSRTAQIASHGRLTACRSRLMRYPDRADDRRASLFIRRRALCMLACVVQGISCA